MPDCMVNARPDIDCLIEQMKRELDEDFAPPHVKRHAHPKMHGCVQASLRVDRDVPDTFRHGVFKDPGRTYRAWVRFSNAFQVQHDLRVEGRGMAIKLLDLTEDDGAPLCPPGLNKPLEVLTQDFVMGTHDVFVLPTTDPRRFPYTEFAAAARKGFIALLRTFVRRRVWRGLIALIRGATVLARNPLAIPYFSQTPYQLGPHVIKFHARPRMTRTLAESLPGRLRFRGKCWLVTLLIELAQYRAVGAVLQLIGFAGTRAEAEAFCHRFLASRNYLREVLAAFLARSSAQFEIMVQLQTDPVRMPTDNATVRWSERLSPYRRVAVLEIPRQVFSPATGMPRAILKAASLVMERGENMSFSPWHGLEAHEPLGDINEVRGRIYAAMATFRREERNRLKRLPDPYACYDELSAILQFGELKDLTDRDDCR